MNNSQSNNQNFINVLKKYFRKEDVFLVPNILCYIRILLVIAFLCFYLIPITIHGNTRAGMYIAAACIMLAAYSDFIDGYIARTFDQKSDLGKILDPIADKFLQCAVAVALMVKFHYFPSVFIMFAIFMGKEITLVFEDISLAKRNRTFGGAKWYGKMASFIFYVITAILLVGGPFLLDAYPVVGQNATEESIAIAHNIFDWLCSFASLWLLISWILYFRLYLKLRIEGPLEVEQSSESEKGISDHD